MLAKGLVNELNLIQAINQLSSIADLSQEVIQQTLKNDPNHLGYVYPWLDLTSSENTLMNIRNTFRVILDYFKNLHSQERDRLTDPEIQRGLRSLMDLSQNAVIKIDQNLSFLKEDLAVRSLSYLNEYHELMDFYQKKLLRKLEKEEEHEGLWRDDWKEATISDTHVKDFEGIKDLAEIKEDGHYELFFIKQENGRQHFSKELLRSIHLLHDFDPIIFSELSENLFEDIDKIQNQDVFLSAQEIKQSVVSKLEYFFKRQDHFRSSELYAYLSYSLYALFLASAPQSLDLLSKSKDALRYFSDFARFLQQAFTSNDFRQFSQVNLQEIDRDIKDLMELIYGLCLKLFLRVESKDKMIGFIYKLLDKPTFSRKKVKERNPLHLWKTLEEEYALFTKIMQRYPSGPLNKTLEYLKNPQDEEAYDFINMGNYACILYDIQMLEHQTVMMRLPSPTKQTHIQKAEDATLFKMFLKSLAHAHPHAKVLLINLQDRTSWQEYARCACLESLSGQGGDYESLKVCSLARNTSFYHQIDEYLEMDAAKDFIHCFKEQFKDEKICGYYFTKEVESKAFHVFIMDLIDVIYKEVFLSRPTLSQKNRQDIIEITHYMILLKIQEILRPHFMSLSCKDAIDVGPAFYAGYYGFLKLLSLDSTFSAEDEDFMLYMLYSPALFQRDRLIDRKRFHRCTSALSTLSSELDANRDKMLKAFSKLFEKDFFKYLSVWETKFHTKA